MAISEHERNQTMGHNTSDIFQRNYLSRHVRQGVQRLYRGQAEHTVVRTAGQMNTSMIHGLTGALHFNKGTAGFTE